MTDLSGIVSATQAAKVATRSTNKKAGMDLDMTDFLTLMVASFQNQTMDDTASTSDMMNQMIQMSVVQAINNINSVFSETSNLSYAASLVGKEVTIGQYVGRELHQIVGTVTGTGTLDGQQVIFLGDNMYNLSDVLAVGRLPSDSTGAQYQNSSLSVVSGTGAAAAAINGLGTNSSNLDSAAVAQYLADSDPTNQLLNAVGNSDSSNSNSAGAVLASLVSDGISDVSSSLNQVIPSEAYEESAESAF